MKLPYADNALEPVISARTISFHYGKHHATYVTNLNNLVKGTPYADLSLEEIVVKSAKDPAAKGIFNNSAQVWNHDFYWKSMKSGGGGEPAGKLKSAIDKDFGDVAKFKEAFGKAAVGQFGAGWAWLVAAALVFEFSFVLDCADGQLARLRKTASPLGHLLDFLMDELKAMLLLAAVAVRLWSERHDERFLLVGLVALFCLASGISLTSFMRRPEYGAKPPTAEGQPAEVGQRRGPVGMVLNALEWAARIVVHYPQYLWLCALVDRIDLYFWAYAAVNALYLAKSFAAILFRLGRFDRRPATAAPAPAPAPELP